ncbi:MAG: tetratricopeptide repeat protein [Candidatus Lokiarchaeota archaeon]
MCPDLDPIKDGLDKEFAQGYELIATDKQEAIKYFKKSLKKHPKHFPTHYNLICLYLMENQYSEANKIIDQALKYHSENPFFLYIKGSLLKRSQDFNQALKYFKESLKFEPENFETLVILGNTLRCLERYDEAIQYYDQALEINPLYDLIYENKMSLLNSLHRREDLQNTMNFAAQNYYSQAILDQEEGKIREACINYAKSLRYDFNNISAKEKIEILFEDFKESFDSVKEHGFKLSEVPYWEKKGLLFFDIEHNLNSSMNYIFQQFISYLVKFKIPPKWFRMTINNDDAMMILEIIPDSFQDFTRKNPIPYFKLDDNFQLKLYEPNISKDSLNFFNIRRVNLSIWHDTTLLFYDLGKLNLTLGDVTKNVSILIESLNVKYNQVKLFPLNGKLIAAVEQVPNAFKEFQKKTNIEPIEVKYDKK